MSDSTSERSPRERQVDALIAEYELAAEQGRPLNREEFLEQHAEFAIELREYLDDVSRLHAAVQPIQPDPEDTELFSGSALRMLKPGMKVQYLGDYEILEELGAGGMGVVYKARQMKLKKVVALKMIKVGQLASDEEVRRFQAEARAAAKLDHPGIVAVHEVGVDHRQHYYTMDFVGGGSLSALHREGPVAARHAAELAKELAEAMHYAHSQGIVHRDLKPANVLLTTNGTPRITDFGLAKRLWSDDDSADVNMTETGQVLGTAGYMSPEQATGKTRLMGPPADIYSLGAILYALLTSRAPFVGESQADTILQVIYKEPISPRTLNPSVPRDLETICLKCLEKEPHKRYGTAKLLADDLQRFLERRPVLARPVSRLAKAWRWCARNPGLAASIAISAALLSAVAIVSTVGYTVASHERSVAAQQREEARQNYRLARSAVDSFLVRITDDPNLRSLGLERLRHRLLLSAQAFYEQMASAKSDDPDLKSERALANMKLGSIARELGDIDKSKEHYSSALAIYHELSLTDTDNQEFQASIAQCLLNIGTQYEAKGEFPQALANYLKSQAIVKALHERDSDSAEKRNDYARGLHSLGIYYRKTGEQERAIELFSSALAARKPLLTLKPRRDDFLVDQAITLNAHGAALLDLERFDAARKMIEESVALREDLSNRNPHVELYLSELADAYGNLASMLVNSGSPEKAAKYFQSALDAQRRIAQAHPDVPAYQMTVVRTQVNMGIMHRELGQVKDAQIALETAATDGHKLLREHGASLEHQVVVATCDSILGGLHHKAGDFARAVKHRQASLQIMEPLVGGLLTKKSEQKLFASALTSLDNQRSELGDSLYALALGHTWGQRNAEAVIAAGDVLKMLRHLREKYPENGQVVRRETEARLILAVAQARLGKYEPAAQEVEAALANEVLTNDIAFNAACALSILSGSCVDDPIRQESYATQAVALLAWGFSEGILTKDDAKQLKGDKDLVAIRDRDDFQKLLREHLTSSQ